MASEILFNIGSANGFSLVRRQVIDLINTDLLTIGTNASNFSEIRINVRICSFLKMLLKIPSAKYWEFCLGYTLSNTTKHHKSLFVGH